MTIIELLGEYKKASIGVLNATEQAVYFRLTLIWNDLRRPEWFSVSDPQLKKESGISSHHTVTKARRGLEDKGFIKSRRTASRRPLMYHLEMLASTAENAVPTTSESDVPTAKIAVPTTAENAVPEEQEKSLRQKLPQATAENAVPLRQKMPYGTAKNADITERDFTEITESLSKVGTTLEVHTPPERETPPLPDDLLIYYHRFNPTPKQTEKDKLAIWAEQYTKTAVMDAIDIAIENEAHNIKYIGKVLENSKGDIHGPRHKAYGGGYQTTIDPQAERDKWRHETSGWD